MDLSQDPTRSIAGAEKFAWQDSAKGWPLLLLAPGTLCKDTEKQRKPTESMHVAEQIWILTREAWVQLLAYTLGDLPCQSSLSYQLGKRIFFFILQGFFLTSAT